MVNEKAQESPPRARPGRPRSEEKRDAILHAAGNLFLEHGVERTSMDAVAQRAGVSKQTVYSHFAGKEDLLNECVGCKLEDYQLGTTLDTEGLPLREGLLVMASRFLDLVYDEGVVSMYRVIIGSSTAHPDLAQLFFAAGPLRTIDAFTRFIAGHAAAGRLCVDEPRLAGEMLIGMLTGGAHMRRILNVAESPDQAARHAWAERCVAAFLKIYAAA